VLRTTRVEGLEGDRGGGRYLSERGGRRLVDALVTVLICGGFFCYESGGHDIGVSMSRREW
jgi:hypothetical protein